MFRTDLADEYVMIGAHYDHLGNNACATLACPDTDRIDRFFNRRSPGLTLEPLSWQSRQAPSSTATARR